MRIKRLDLLAFGPFTNRTLDLSEGNPGLHVVLGPNEAGKSSTLRALKAWLFGIDARSTDNFVHDYKQLRVGGVLETTGGKEISCVRRKGNKDTLLDSRTDEPIGDDVLSNLLPGLDEKLFSQLHGIDYEGLVQGGQAILEQSGDLGKSLFGAALGTKGKTDILSELASEADKLFRTRGQIQIINAAAAELKEARRVERHESVSVRNWKDLQKALKEAEEGVARIDEDIVEAKRSKNKLERFKRVVAPLSERRELLDLLAAQGDVVLLPEDFGSRRQNALAKLALARERLQKASARLARVQHEAGELDVPQGLLENQEAIENLQLQLGAVQKSVKDKPAQDAKRRDHRNAAQALLTSIRPDLDLETVQTLKPLLNKKKLIASLAQDSSLLKQKIGQFEAKLRELSDEKTSLKQELDDMSGPGKDVASLQAAILEARKSGDLAKMLIKAREAVSQQEDACSRELSRLGRFDGDLEDLTRRSMPERAVLENFEKKFDELADQIRETVRRQAEAREELGEYEENLKRLLRSSEVPSLEDLQSTRKHREQGWKLIRCKYIEGEELGAAATEYSGSKHLPDAYEQAVLAADEVGDRLRLDAQRVQERVNLETLIQTRNDLISSLDKKLTDFAPIRAHLENAWEAAWQGITTQFGTPKEMKEWLQRVEQLLQKAVQLENARVEFRSLESTQALHLESLTAELEKLGYKQEHGANELEALLVHSEQIASEQEATVRRQGEIEAALKKLEIQLKGAKDSLLQVNDEMQQWEATWADAVDGLGIGTKPHRELALETMDKLEELFQELKEADTAHKRIYGMDKDEERFTDAVTIVTQQIGIDTGGRKPAEVTLDMVKQLAKAQADAATLHKLGTQISELEEEIAEANQVIQMTEYSCAALRTEAGVTCDEEIGPVEEASRLKRQRAIRLETLEQQLYQSGEGYSLDELEKEALELDADQVADELLRLDTRLSDLTSERDEMRDNRKALLVQIQELDGSSKAAEAAERAEQLLAGIVPNAEQYLRVTIARLILEEQIERYRKNNQTPVLRRAGELFAKLTLGSFSGLRDEIDDKGKPILLGVRPDKTEVGVDGMSEGTRDQLFLALRLSTIELQGAQLERLPFVVDDIMVGFDDERSKACLEVLAEFARNTQVLVFTHHAMVAQAANELGSESDVFVHHLAGSLGTTM
jgi:uncharacterized protein YhaN